MRRLVLVLAIGCGGSHAGGVDGAPGDGLPGDGVPGDGVPGDGAPGDGPAACTASCTPGQWCTETAPVASTTLLSAVVAVGGCEAFAVGSGGTILHRQGTTWSTMTSNTMQALSGVWAASPSNVWAVGAGGTILRYNGSSWAPATGISTTADLSAVWGSSANDVWIVGVQRVLHWNGTAWNTPWTGPAPGGVLLAVSGTGPSDVWVAGESAYIQHFTGTGTAWSGPIDPAGTTTYFAILADPTAVWVTSSVSTKETESLTGTTWTPHGTGGVVFQSLYAAHPSDVWGVAQTKVGNWNGSAWTASQPAGVTQSLWGVSGSGADVFVVGAGAMILHRD